VLAVLRQLLCHMGVLKLQHFYSLKEILLLPELRKTDLLNFGKV
jgi:hypothetical protein